MLGICLNVVCAELIHFYVNFVTFNVQMCEYVKLCRVKDGGGWMLLLFYVIRLTILLKDSKMSKNNL